MFRLPSSSNIKGCNWDHVFLLNFSLKSKKIFPNSRETLKRSFHCFQQRITLTANLAAAFHLPFMREIKWKYNKLSEISIFGLVHMSWNSIIYDCTTLRMSLIFRRLVEMLIVNKPITKFFTLAWRFFLSCNVVQLCYQQPWSLLENFQYFTTQNI